MQHSVKNYIQGNNSILSVAVTPRHGAISKRRRKLFSLKKSLVSPAQFISLYGGSFQKNLQVKKNVVYLQCQTVVRKSLQNIQNRIFSKYSTLDLERPKGLHSSCYGLTTPFREFFVVTKFNFNR